MAKSTFLKSTRFVLIIFLLLSAYFGFGQTKVVLPGTFQSELGCAPDTYVNGDWEPSCDATALSYNATSGMYEGSFNLPAGCWAYKVALNGSWSENYGLNGEPGGLNIPLYVPVAGVVTFVYDPITHIVTSSPYTSGVACPPETVVLPGSFQSELGCTPVTFINGDWEPGCDYTRLSYNNTSGLWEGTFDLPAGYWEFKVAINNSWVENYGLYGMQNGSNIPLELCAPTRITFKYSHTTHMVELVPVSTSICIRKYYDANVNGVYDFGEQPLSGIEFRLSGASSTVQYTDAAGTTSFTNLEPGNYTVTEMLPSGYVGTVATAQTVALNLPQKMDFGNVCLGPGGGHSIGYWMSKNGQQTLNDYGGPESELAELRYMNLRNADGSNFDPFTYAQLREWLKNANAKNMAYMLSAQLAAMYLNLEAGFIYGSWSAILYTPGMGTLGNGSFSYMWFVYWQSEMSLSANGSTVGQHPNRKFQELLKNILDQANNNYNFVQSAPCTVQASFANRYRSEINTQPFNKLLWPNPSSGQFNLRVTSDKIRTLQINVFDVTGRRMLSMNGATNKDLNFGSSLKPGIYFVEIINDGQRTTERIIKQ